MMRALTIVMVMVASGAQAQGNGRLGWVDGNAGRIRVTDGGRGGLPVVFVHSLAGDHTQWDAQLAHVRQTRRAVAFDSRGHGESEGAADTDYSLGAVADDLEAVVNGLGIDRFVLVGHSFGGGVAATFAGRAPERVAAVFFADPIGDQRSVAMQIEGLVQMLRGAAYRETVQAYYASILMNASPGVRESVLATVDATPPAAVIGGFGSLAAFDPNGALNGYDGPMISVISDLNNFPFSLHNVVPGLTAVTMTGTSHWLQMDRPEEFNGHLDRFLSDVR